jgi:hypothetical protein
MARWLDARRREGDRELALLAFRSSGKSTIVGLYSAWLLSNNPNIRILVLASDFALAKKMVRNVKRIIERHPMTAALKPTRADHWASDQFTVQRTAEWRDPSMLSKGIFANITGLRADIIICDDVEVPNTCDTAAKREDLRSRLQEIQYICVPGGTKLFIGTPHHSDTIYVFDHNNTRGEERGFLSGFKHLDIPVMDRGGNSNWPERFSKENITDIRKRSGVSKFESQMMLRPQQLKDGRLNPFLLKKYDQELIHVYSNDEAILILANRRIVSASCWWDPSYGSSLRGDASVVACVYTDECGDYWLHRVEYMFHDIKLSETVDEATQLCRQVVNLVRDFFLPSINIETNGLGRFLPGLLRQELRRAGVLCAVVERTTSRGKDLRIVDAFDAVLAAGRLHAHRSVWNTNFIREMQEWRPGSKSPDDGLDAVAGCLLSEPVRLPIWPTSKIQNLRSYAPWRSRKIPMQIETDFEF